MNEEMMNRSYKAQAEGESLGRYTAKAFGWMFAGLLITFVVVVGGYMTRTVAYVYAVPYWYYTLLAVELGVAIFLSARTEKVFIGIARVLFFLHAAFSGIVFCTYLIVFGPTILQIVFGTASVFFGIMVLIGWFDNINFVKVRPSTMGSLIFLVFFWLLVMFIDFSAFKTTVSMIGIFLFLTFTAHDTKKIQAYHAYYGQVSKMAAKTSVFAAPQLYLDFINLFAHLLRVLGRGES